ncbi:DUF2510 domain-containing protein [Streptomyces sp. NRRL S-118]|uniref:DUF2510 domain-containing protein n=1 Tax=Streptomyces sp. NRRL S-118 TaxID=1463881 RepID=UPI000AF4FD94|nr:DUF2510 domain-containing protein [Streptomyces sp. NRRL S-118]
MSMTTPPPVPGGTGGPPGWYPEPGNPAVEHWWDGTAWTGHTRSPGRNRAGRALPVAAAGVAVVAAIAVAAVMLAPGDETVAPPVSAATSSAPPTAVPAPAPSPTPSATPEEDPTVLVDQLNGITLPVPDGWEKPEFTTTDVPTVVTVAQAPCPADTGRDCRRGTVTSSTVSAAAGASYRAIAEQDIKTAADRAYEKDALGNRYHGGIRSHRLVASRPAVVAGRTGHLVRWRVTTAFGPGGWVQSLAFPSPMGSESPVVVRFAFDAGPDGPDLALMDEITRGIRPIGSSTGGGVGSSIGP